MFLQFALKNDQPNVFFSKHSRFICVNFVRVKGNLRPKTHHCFYGITLFIFYGKRALNKVLWCFDQFPRSYEVAKFWLQLEWCHTLKFTNSHPIHSWFPMHIFVNFIEKELFTHIYGRVDHLSWAYEVPKFWVIKLCHDISDVIHTNKLIQYADCGLHVNFWKFCLIQFCFTTRKSYFERCSHANYIIKYMIVLIQITNTEIFPFITAPVFRLLSREVSFIKKRQ